jgi:protection-of-telomeres protein 1
MICNIKRKGSTGTSTSVFSPALIPEAAYTQTFLGGDSDLPSHGRGPNSRPSKSEQMYAFCLKQFSQTLTSTTGPLKTTEHNPSGPPAANQSAPALKTRKQKFQLISGVSYNDYCDLVVEVVKKYPDSHGNMELYVTDYTSHDALFDYPSSQEADADTELYR